VPKNVLVLGAGMISPPLLRYILSRTDARVVVGALDISKAEQVLSEYPHGRAVQLDVQDTAALTPFVNEADVVVSLLPAGYNARIAELAIARRIPMLNTSYVAPSLAALDGAAKQAGVLILSETGLDPGLDHMSTVRLVRRVRATGGRIERFVSCCGGFPAPDANNNPWGYKFSWFPRQVLLSGRSPARYLRGGQIVDVPGPELYAHAWPYAIDDLGVFEIYPNRDSVQYRNMYGLADADGLLRATLRYPGWCATLKAAADLGWTDIDTHQWAPGTTYADVSSHLLPAGAGTLIDRLAGKLGLSSDSEVLSRLEWAGLLSDRHIGTTSAAPIDLFVNRLAALMMYKPGERDMIVMEHRLNVAFPDGHTEEITSTLTTTGEPWGDSAMSRTVALPIAVATRLVLNNAIDEIGVQVPIQPDIYRPVLDELANLGLAFRDERHIRYVSPLA
jgi:saccharopine dehydrogenase-like NADP-dependent oxidoreductase